MVGYLLLILQSNYMNDRSSQTSTSPSGSPAEKENEGRSWLERIGHALIGEISSTVQILELLRDAKKRHIIGNDELSMIEGVLEVKETQVREIMLPRSQMMVLKIDDPIEDVLNEIVSSSHSRYPVIGDSKDDIEGILLAKDVLTYCLSNQKDDLKIRDILRPAVIIPESKRLNVLLKDFREFKNHIAIIVDEYGGVSGMVTIEDVLEEIVGDIEDEYDIEDENSIIELGENQYTINSLTPIDEFNEYFSVHLNDEEFDTIGGVVMNAFGHFPMRNEEITIEQFHFKVLKSDRRRIYLLHITKL